MQKKATARGRPSKGDAAKAKVIQVRVDAKLERHIKAEGGSAFVRSLIEKSMKNQAKQNPKGAIKKGPNEKAVSDAMTKLGKKETPKTTKELAAEVGDYRKAAIKEGAKPKPAKAPAKKPAAKAPAARPAAKAKVAKKK